MRKGVTIEVRDAHGNIVKREWDEPKPPPDRSWQPSDMAACSGVTFHQQPCGAYVATAGSYRVCGPVGSENKDLVASLMLTWLAWDSGGRRR
jgi:hypothetical protein